jgi:hypothetical protein
MHPATTMQRWDIAPSRWVKDSLRAVPHTCGDEATGWFRPNTRKSSAMESIHWINPEHMVVINVIEMVGEKNPAIVDKLVPIKIRHEEEAWEP